MPSVLHLNEVFNNLLNNKCNEYMSRRYGNASDSLLSLSAYKIRENGQIKIEDIETKLLKSTAEKIHSMETIIDANEIKGNI